MKMKNKQLAIITDNRGEVSVVQKKDAHTVVKNNSGIATFSEFLWLTLIRLTLKKGIKKRQWKNATYQQNQSAKNQL